MTVLSTFLEFCLNFVSNNLKITTKFDTVREKNSVKIWTNRNTVSKDSQGLHVKSIEWQNDSFKYIFEILIKFAIK